MKALKTITLSAAACIAGLMLFSCQDDPQTTEPATFSIDQDTVYAKAEGGTLSVQYTLTNAQDGLSVQPDTEADWINGLDASQTGIISFVVSENRNIRRASGRLQGHTGRYCPGSAGGAIGL